MNYIWVVEAQFDERPGVWEPTAGVKLTRADARIELKAWKLQAGIKCRLRKYWRAR